MYIFLKRTDKSTGTVVFLCILLECEGALALAENMQSINIHTLPDEHSSMDILRRMHFWCRHKVFRQTV